eukprot:366519-Chlamydomonas_euryale.AAC.8
MRGCRHGCAFKQCPHVITDPSENIQLVPGYCQTQPQAPKRDAPCAEGDVYVRAGGRKAPEALVELVALVRLDPRRHAAVHLPHEHAKRVHVTCLGQHATLNHLGGHVVRGAARGQKETGVGGWYVGFFPSVRLIAEWNGVEWSGVLLTKSRPGSWCSLQRL